MLKDSAHRLFWTLHHGWNTLFPPKTPDLYTVASRYLPKNPICVDAGAGIGSSVRRMKVCFDQPTIYAFEPNKECYKRLVRKFDTDDKVILSSYALSDFDKLTMRFYVDANRPFVSSFHRRLDSETSVQLVRCVRLVDQNIKDIDFLKIDVQGHELQVLKSAGDSIARTILIELMFWKVHQGQGRWMDILQFLDVTHEMVSMTTQYFNDGSARSADALFVRRIEDG